MVQPTKLRQGLVTAIGASGVEAMVIPPFVQAGFITNPLTTNDQRVSPVEPLYVSQIDPATNQAFGTTIALQPGDTYSVEPYSTYGVFVNAASKGHSFSAVYIGGNTQYPPTPLTGPFPPAGPTTMTSVIPAYVYENFWTDPDIQSFFYALNQLQQKFIDTINSLNLPIWTDKNIKGKLLDWVARGIYGMKRPTLSSGFPQLVGPYNTWAYGNGVTAYNGDSFTSAGPYQATSDDTFKRILTWHLYKGDGKIFNVRWLKRRVMRFLNGVDGTDPPVDETYQVSVTFGTGNQVNINIVHTHYIYLSGAQYNGFCYNQTSKLLLWNSIASISWSGGTVTVTTVEPHGLMVSDSYDLVIEQASPSGYNGPVTATATTLNQFTYPLVSDPGVSTAAGFWRFAGAAVLNIMPYNQSYTEQEVIPEIDAQYLIEAINSGALELPFQFDWVVTA